MIELSNNSISILCGLLASISYAYFSKKYEPLTRKVDNPLIPAILLYGGSAIYLLILSVGLAFFFGWHFSMNEIITIFGNSFSNVRVILLFLILAMSYLYYKHIITEAESRKTINMGAYSVLFQINIIIIALVDWLSYKSQLSWEIIIGGILLFISSTGILAGHYFFANRDISLLKLSKRTIYISILSAVTCGFALCIDGEIGRNYIFVSGNKMQFISTFVFYEMLTFGIPSILALVNYIWQTKTFDSLNILKSVFKDNKSDYLLSSFFSASQFVFSVFALSLPESRYIAAVALGLSPILSVNLDKNKRPLPMIRLEIVLALVALFGFYLIMKE